MVTINLIGKKDSIALMVLLAMNDLIFLSLKYGYGIFVPKRTNRNFNGLLKTFATNTTADNDNPNHNANFKSKRKRDNKRAFRRANTTTLSAQAGNGFKRRFWRRWGRKYSKCRNRPRRFHSGAGVINGL